MLITSVIIAVMAAATGSIFEQVSLPNILGSVVIVFLCGLLNFKGSKVIEKFESVGTVLLYGGYILFTIIVLVKKGGNIPQVFAAMDTSAVGGSVTLPLCIWTGILYVAYNINAIPMGMFSLTRQTKRKETLVSGIIAGLLMVIPWFLSYFAMMCFYGDTSIVGADVATPWMEMIKAVNGGPVLLGLFSLVMGWTLVETATGCIHMIIDRFDVALAERGNAKMSDRKRGLITGNPDCRPSAFQNRCGYPDRKRLFLSVLWLHPFLPASHPDYRRIQNPPSQREKTVSVKERGRPVI